MADQFEKVTGREFDEATPESPVYQSEYSDDPSTKQDFLDLVNGDEVAARNLFDCCEWQHPATLIDEHGGIAFFKGASDDICNKVSELSALGSPARREARNEVAVLHGRWDDGDKTNLFLAIYDKNDNPLYKDNNQDKSKLAMLIGQEAAAKVLANEGDRPEGSPENYRKFTVSPDVLHSSIYMQYSIPLKDIHLEKDVTPEVESDEEAIARMEREMATIRAERDQKFTDVCNASSTYAKLLSKFMPASQLKALVNNVGGEEGAFFQGMLAKLHQNIRAMPATREQDGLGDDAIAHLHYFSGGSNWYITERDIGENGTRAAPIGEQQQAFGLADLFGDGGELGYISIEELKSAGVELDLFWNPVAIGEIKTRQIPAAKPKM